MPRRSSGPKLWPRPEVRNPDGSLRRRGVWIILDAGRQIRTGCAPADVEGANRALADYIASKYQPPTGKRDPAQIPVADVLMMYLTDVAPKRARESEIRQRIAALEGWWGDRTLADVTGRNCRAYVAHRTAQPWKACKPEKTGKPPRMVSEAAARRELEDLRAAINHHRTEGLCSEIVAVRLPDKPMPREGWLTRSELARLRVLAGQTEKVLTIEEINEAIAAGWAGEESGEE